MPNITIDRYAVMGNPITHSKSPQIHQQFAAQTRQQLSYEKIQVETDDFSDAVARFQQNNGKGLNITVPLKEHAFKIANQLTERARRAGAVNTLILNATNNYTGDNTDGIGLVRDLMQNHDTELANKDILILGAGGAVRGILEPFIQQRPDRLLIANRTLQRAEDLAEDFSDIFHIETSEYTALEGLQFDIIINGTSASLSGDLPPLPEKLLKNTSTAYDMMYGKEDTPFMLWAKQNNATKILDGLGMLVEQAAESFYCWRHIRPDTKPVITSIRRNM
ncbi:MAG: shikimate dehydrogenase [Gammaproteobacteria bacterium]|nr:shikimate dehydrogenase [Gammaproteobacteria bacterium]